MYPLKDFQFVSQTKVYFLLLMLLFLAACGDSPNNTQTSPPAGLSPLNLGIPAEVLNSPITGTLDSNTSMRVNVFFKLNQSQQNQLQQITTNQQDLEKVANTIGITETQYEQVKSYLGIQNITLHLSKLHTSLEVDGIAQTMARLFQTSFVKHKYQNRDFYAPKTPPLVPTAISPFIVSITGLDNYSPPLQTEFARRAWHPTAPGVAQADCNVSADMVAPQDVAHTYGYDWFLQKGYTGKGSTINLVEIDGYPEADVGEYGACVGYKGNITVKTVGTAPTDPGLETALDIEMIQGLAPDVDIVDYQTDGTHNGIAEALKQIIDDNTNKAGYGNVVSISLESAENFSSFNNLTAINQELSVLTNIEHMTVFIASGDCGAFMDDTFNSYSVSFPASDPNAVAVGGTILEIDANSNRTHETAWFDPAPDKTKCNNSWGTGGGNSVHFQQPAWQTGPGVKNDASRGFRQVPDVAAVASNLPIYFNGQWQQTGGTSASTPIWAAGMIMINQATIQNYGVFFAGPPIFYAIANSPGKFSPYFDITEGNNQGFNATPGWDFTTGLGVPNLEEVYNILAATSSKK